MLALSDYPVIHIQAVAWGDMDAFGHVNNVMYYRYKYQLKSKHVFITKTL